MSLTSTITDIISEAHASAKWSKMAGSRITNTQAMFDNPIARLQGLMPGDGGRIEAMEEQGQRELVESSALPVECNGYGDEAKASGRAALEHAGVVFGAPVDGDPLFQSVTLPAGWTIAATSHAMWSNLLDDKGRERAAIFYKAAFYDRRAFWNATPRYSHTFDYDQPDDWRDANERVLIKRDGVVVHSFDVTKVERFSDEGRAAGERWMAENRPDFRNPGAYWDEPS